jgi:hypothetical protein
MKSFDEQKNGIGGKVGRQRKLEKINYSIDYLIKRQMPLMCVENKNAYVNK